MAERVEVIYQKATGNDGRFTRYYGRDVVALLTKGDIVYLDDTPWAVGYYEIVLRTIKFDPTAERLDTIYLLLKWRSYYPPSL